MEELFKSLFTLGLRLYDDFGLCRIIFYTHLLFLGGSFCVNIPLPYSLVSQSQQTRQVNEDSASFISFSSCDVTWRSNFTPSFSFHFIKTSRDRGVPRKLVKKCCRDGGYRRAIIVVYAKKIQRKRDKTYNVMASNLRPITRRIDLDYVTNE